MSADNYQVVFVTAQAVEEGENIARTLVSESLAACVNVINGCRSIYRWEGKVVQDDEVLLVIKSRRGLFEQLAARVNELHSYEVPEVVGIDIARTSLAYGKFLGDVLRGDA